MRAFVERTLVFAFLGVSTALLGRVLAQAPSVPPSPEQTHVQSQKSLDQYRVELGRARAEILEMFNEATTSSDDVICRNERPTGSRMTQRVCRSKATEKADADATWAAIKGGISGDTSGVPVRRPQSDTRGVAVSDNVDADVERLIRENSQFYQAIVEYMALEEEYNRARAERAQ